MNLADTQHIGRPRIQPKQLSEYLEIWREWMQGYDNKQSYPSRDSIMSGTGSKAFDAMVATMETEQAKTVDAAVDDLPAVERSAVYHVKLACVVQLREPIMIVWERAFDMLAIDLARRGLPTGED